MADDPSFHDKPVEWTLTAPEASRDGSAHPSPQSNALPLIEGPVRRGLRHVQR